MASTSETGFIVSGYNQESGTSIEHLSTVTGAKIYRTVANDDEFEKAKLRLGPAYRAPQIPAEVSRAVRRNRGWRSTAFVGQHEVDSLGIRKTFSAKSKGISRREGESIEEYNRRRDRVLEKLEWKMRDRMKEHRLTKSATAEQLISARDQFTRERRAAKYVDARARPHILARSERYAKFKAALECVLEDRLNKGAMCHIACEFAPELFTFTSTLFKIAGMTREPSEEGPVSKAARKLIADTAALPYANLRQLSYVLNSMTESRPAFEKCVTRYVCPDYHDAPQKLYDHWKEISDFLGLKYSQFDGVDHLDALRVLLLIAGVEPNPGPKGNKAKNRSKAEKNLVKNAVDRAIHDPRVKPVAVPPPSTQQALMLKQMPYDPKKFTQEQKDLIINMVAIEQAKHQPDNMKELKEIAAGIAKSYITMFRTSGKVDTRGLHKAAKSAGADFEAGAPSSASSNRPSTPKKSKGQNTRGGKNAGLVSAAIADANARAAAADDSAREMLVQMQELQDDCTERLQAQEQEYEERIEDLRDQVKAANGIVESAREAGYLPLEESRIINSFSFRGHFEPGMLCTFDSKHDELIKVKCRADHYWLLENCGAFTRVCMPPEALYVAAWVHPCDSKEKAYKNMYAALNQSPKMKEYYERCNDTFRFAIDQNLRAFILTGMGRCTGKEKWLSNCEEWVPEKYTCAIDPDWRTKLKNYVFAPDLLKLEAKCAKCCRGAVIRVNGLNPHLPLWCDFGTLVAGICKRLEPVLPPRRRYMAEKICEKVLDFCDLVTRTTGNRPELLEGDILQMCEEAMQNRPERERLQMWVGIQMCVDDYDVALRTYLTYHYKAFVKLETYLAGSFKPPRFIMSMDLVARGIQLYSMLKVLRLIEEVTLPGNVKHLSADEITKKLKRKFKNVFKVAETDFSSFESCISPWMKQHVENYIYKHIAGLMGDEGQNTLNFVTHALDRETVYLDGPGFINSRFHHIRMSGDLWTSIGNLVTNVVIIASINDWTIEDTLKKGLFEGDDGVFPAPDTLEGIERLKRRARDCGVLLTFDVAPWYSLSFCGNHMEMVNGELVRHRDPLKTLMNLCVLFSPNYGTKKYDIMLQRSKCLSVLDGPWVPGASVFAAVVEFCTRGCRVDEEFLLRHGYLKEYSSYGVESCVPACLACQTDPDEFATMVEKLDFLGGGDCSKQTILDMINTIDGSSGSVELPAPMDITRASGQHYARDGLVFSHAAPEHKTSLLRMRKKNYFTHQVHFGPFTWHNYNVRYFYGENGQQAEDNMMVEDYAKSIETHAGSRYVRPAGYVRRAFAWLTPVLVSICLFGLLFLISYCLEATFDYAREIRDTVLVADSAGYVYDQTLRVQPMHFVSSVGQLSMGVMFHSFVALLCSAVALHHFYPLIRSFIRSLTALPNWIRHSTIVILMATALIMVLEGTGHGLLRDEPHYGFFSSSPADMSVLDLEGAPPLRQF